MVIEFPSSQDSQFDKSYRQLRSSQVSITSVSKNKIVVVQHAYSGGGLLAQAKMLKDRGPGFLGVCREYGQQKSIMKTNSFLNKNLNHCFEINLRELGKSPNDHEAWRLLPSFHNQGLNVFSDPQLISLNNCIYFTYQEQLNKYFNQNQVHSKK